MKLCSILIGFTAVAVVFLSNQLCCNEEIFVAEFFCVRPFNYAYFCTSDKKDYFTKINTRYKSTDTTLSNLMRKNNMEPICGFGIFVWSKFTIKFVVFFRLSWKNTIGFLPLVLSFRLKIAWIVKFSALTPKLWNSEYNWK